MIDSPIMIFDPTTGRLNPNPNREDEYREFFGTTAWLYNPWNGQPRDPRDIGTDVTGLLIFKGNEKLKAWMCAINKWSEFSDKNDISCSNATTLQEQIINISSYWNSFINSVDKDFPDLKTYQLLQNFFKREVKKIKL